MFYYKLKNIDYDPIRQELVRSTELFIKEGRRFYDPSFQWVRDNCPLLTEFLSSNTKVPVRFSRFYFTQPFKNMNPHMDGFFWNPSRIGLNFPVCNTENTEMQWFDTGEDNLTAGLHGVGDKTKPGINTGSRVKDESLLKKLDSTVIDHPTFVKTDIVHNVTNPNPTVRAILSVRFFIMSSKNIQFEDLIQEIYKF